MDEYIPKRKREKVDFVLNTQRESSDQCRQQLHTLHQCITGKNYRSNKIEAVYEQCELCGICKDVSNQATWAMITLRTASIQHG